MSKQQAHSNTDLQHHEIMVLWFAKKYGKMA
jgi:hypothetical protein